MEFSRVVGVAIVSVVAGTSCGDIIPEFKNCNDAQKANLTRAREFLVQQIEYMRDFDDLAPTKVRSNAIRRRMARYVDDIKFNCSKNDACDGAVGYLRGGQVNGAFAKRMGICIDRMEGWGADECDLVEVMAHEFGHMCGMPVKIIDHNEANDGRRDDRVYRLGFHMEDRCRELIPDPQKLR